jgi:hypothetical protein
LERPNAHLYETGAMRRTHLRGHTNILKRVLIHMGGFNLGLIMRHLIGVGTPRSCRVGSRRSLTGEPHKQTGRASGVAFQISLQHPSPAARVPLRLNNFWTIGRACPGLQYMMSLTRNILSSLQW